MDIDSAFLYLLFANLVVGILALILQCINEWARIQDRKPKPEPFNREEWIRNVAYAMWEMSGKPEGDGQEFWLQAERALDGKVSSPQPTPTKIHISGCGQRGEDGPPKKPKPPEIVTVGADFDLQKPATFFLVLLIGAEMAILLYAMTFL